MTMTWMRPAPSVESCWLLLVQKEVASVWVEFIMNGDASDKVVAPKVTIGDQLENHNSKNIKFSLVTVI